jgi:hypothetical protein
MVVNCTRGFEPLISAARKAHIASIHFVLSRKAWDDSDRRDQNLNALKDASEFLHQVQDHAGDYIVMDAEARHKVSLARKAVVALSWLTDQQTYSPLFGELISECCMGIDEVYTQLSQKYSDPAAEITISNEMLQKPAELFSTAYGLYATEVLSRPIDIW